MCAKSDIMELSVMIYMYAILVVSQIIVTGPCRLIVNYILYILIKNLIKYFLQIKVRSAIQAKIFQDIQIRFLKNVNANQGENIL